LGGLLSDELDLLLAVSSLVILCTFVDVLLTILQHSIDQSGKPMSHSGDGFWGAELAAQAAVLRAEVGLTSQSRKPKPRGRITPQPSTWHGRAEQISLDQVGCEARKTPAEGDVFFLDISLYRTNRE
jgi:hypothetical protein